MSDSTKLTDDELAVYQARLLDILHRGNSGPDMIAEILSAAGPFASALAGLDADLVEVAADLTRTWARPTPPPH